MNFKYSLSKKGKISCPKCGKTTFVKYIDTETQNYLSDEFGRCDRESACAYHNRPLQGKIAYSIPYISLVNHSDKSYKLKTPNDLIHYVPKSAILEQLGNSCFVAEWYLRNAKIQYLTNECKRFEDDGVVTAIISKVPSIELPPSFHELELLDKMYNNKTNCNFIEFLKQHFSDDEVLTATQNYLITGTDKPWTGSVVFWQIDKEERIRHGKIMQYDPKTGKRVKQNGKVLMSTIRFVLKLDDFTIKQCLFGLHLTTQNYSKPIGLVESEKTAVMMSLFVPEFIWLATGSLNGFKSAYLEPIKKRQIIAFPDKGEFQSWEDKAELLRKSGFKITLNKFIDTNHKYSDCQKGFDLADAYLLGNIHRKEQESYYSI